MKAWHGVLTITVVATLLGLAFYDRMAGSENQALVQRMEAALSTGNAYRKQLAKVKTIQVVRTQRFREFVLVADTASTDSARVIALRAAVGACSTALLACSERALLAEARVAELEPLLTRGLKIVDCHIAGLHFLPRCPSRTVTAVVATVSGIVVGYAIR